MRSKNLFGIPVPEGAVRVVIRPVLGPGGSLPIYKGSFDDGVVPEDDDVVYAAAKNTQFWDYWDSRKGATKAGTAELTEWKVRLQFFDAKETDESFTTDRSIAFYRSRQAKAQGGAGKSLRFLRYLRRSSDRSMAQMSKSLHKIAETATTAIAKTSEASADALKEVCKQTSVVGEMVRLHQEEAAELKEALLALTAKSAKPASAPVNATQQLRDLLDVGKTFMNFADGWAGAAKADPPTSAGAK